MSTPQAARAVLRCLDHERRLVAQLAEVRANRLAHERRLMDAAGLYGRLNPAALEQLAVERAG